MPIRIFVTGGTFDKEYDELTGEMCFQDSHVKSMLQLGRCTRPVNIRTLMMVDSFEMTDDDREVILKNCRDCDYDQIVITHGTDRMEVTARVLGEAIRDKTIILTGAMIPYKFGSSDGLFNLGSALSFAQCLPQGVYVAMNGKYFRWDQVQKNKKTGLFEEIE